MPLLQNDNGQYYDGLCDNKGKRSDIPIVRDIQSLNYEEEKIDFAWIEVTTKCNLRCIHCYDSSSPAEISTMSWKDFRQVCRFIKDNYIKKI